MATSVLFLQTSPSTVGVLGTVGLFGLFLAVTAHLAARNVLGDVSPSKALSVGIAPATIGGITVLLSIPSGIGVIIALVVDGVAIHLLYDQPRRTSLRITAVHAIISVLLGVVLFGGLLLAASIPG